MPEERMLQELSQLAAWLSTQRGSKEGGGQDRLVKRAATRLGEATTGIAEARGIDTASKAWKSFKQNPQAYFDDVFRNEHPDWYNQRGGLESGTVDPTTGPLELLMGALGAAAAVGAGMRILGKAASRRVPSAWRGIGSGKTPSRVPRDPPTDLDLEQAPLGQAVPKPRRSRATSDARMDRLRNQAEGDLRAADSPGTSQREREAMQEIWDQSNTAFHEAVGAGARGPARGYSTASGRPANYMSAEPGWAREFAKHQRLGGTQSPGFNMAQYRPPVDQSITQPILPALAGGLAFLGDSPAPPPQEGMDPAQALELLRSLGFTMGQ
jgi:hypothetical protein